MRKPIASAKPSDHKVYVGRQVFVYGRVRKRELTEGQCFIHFMRQLGKYTLRMVKQIHQSKNNT